MKKLEIALTAIAFIGIMLVLFRIPGGAFLLILSFGVISMFYCYLGFAIYNGIGFRRMFKKESYSEISTGRIVGAILLGVATSITTVGILFRMMSWPGTVVFLNLGVFGLLIALIVALVKLLTTKSDYYKSVIIRIAPWFLLGLICIFYYRELKRFKYRNFPAYVKVYEKYKEHPNDKRLLDSLYNAEDDVRQGRSQEVVN